MSETLDSKTLKALSSDTRQEIIKCLSKRPYTASELSKLMNKHVTTVAEHLETLEKSGLVEKREDGHKWVYYSLSEKGERLFKPQFYSWTVVIVLSLLALLFGIQQFFVTGYRSMAPLADIAASQSAMEKAAGEAAASTSVAVAAPVDYSLIIGIILIALAVIGFSYAAWKWKKNKAIIQIQCQHS